MRARTFLPLVALVGLLAACSEDAASDPPAEGESSAARTTEAAPPAPSEQSAPSAAPASECNADVDCAKLGASDFCGRPVCEGGTCVRKVLEPAGTKLPSQRYGDCHVMRCAPNGIVENVIDEKDVFDDANECTEDVCNGGVPTAKPMPKGYLCNYGICNAAGECVMCNTTIECTKPGTTCVNDLCIPSTCSNGIKDVGEPDIDCGGPCAKCAQGKNCISGLQCASGVCSSGKCVAPTCNDGVTNGDESEVDCGGGTCAPCATDARCRAHSDCASKVCQEGFCNAPSCTDAVRNGNEQGIDCGGSCPPCTQ